VSEISYLIVCRNPKSKKLVIISDGDDPHEYESEDAAYSAAQDIAICRAWGAEIVPVERP